MIKEQFFDKKEIRSRLLFEPKPSRKSQQYFAEFPWNYRIKAEMGMGFTAFDRLCSQEAPLFYSLSFSLLFPTLSIPEISPQLMSIPEPFVVVEASWVNLI